MTMKNAFSQRPTLHCPWARRATGTLGALVVSAAVAAVVAIPTQAAFPGVNGKIVFQTNRDGNADIYTMNGDGTGRVNLTRNPAEDIQPRWSPDGKRIVYTSNRTGHDEIYSMNADGSGVSQLTFMAGINRRPSWTPAGQILFHSGLFPRSIYLMNADGSNPQNLTGNASDNAYATASPNGNRIAFSSTRSGTQRLYTMDLTGGNVHLVTAAPPGPELDDVEANWSPRGNDLVFVRFSEAGSEVFLVHKDGSGLTQLTNTPNRIEFEPAFSPDGSKIAFHACSGLSTTSHHCANYAVNTDGTDETEITTPRIPYLDTFSDTRIDPFWGLPFLTGTGPTIAEANGQLEITVPSSTINDPSAGYVSVGVASACHLNGDFDIQVDYRLLQWPAPALINLDFDTFSFVNGTYETYGMFVFDPGFGTGISTHFPGPVNTFVNAPEPTGTLRFARIGGTITAYRLVGTSWSPLQSTTDTQTDLGMNLNVFSNAPALSHPDVKVAYDNFQINGGTITCPTWWDDSAPDWQPLLK